jgi:hypothetical protein
MISLVGVALMAAACGGITDTDSLGDGAPMGLAGEVSLWPDSAVPTAFATADTGAVEVGVKFKSSQRGRLTALRFYKHSGNTGTHVGSLWSSSGTLLGRVTFSQESASGWQTARFATPVTIEPNTVYVASYHAPRGRYAGVDRGLSQGRTSGPLYALRDGENGGNGVYLRTGSPAFPTASFNGNNYYVDVLFLPETTSSNGLFAEYFDGIHFTSNRVTRTDAAVQFDWGSGQPHPSIAADTFTVRWTGQLLAPRTGTYTFTTRSDDGVRLWVDNKLLVDNWTDHAATDNSGQVTLTAGQRYNIRLDYFENGGAAVMKLDWTVPGAGRAAVPTANLFPSATSGGGGPVCTPSCGGKQCGSDGCGGVCGTCAGSMTCSATGQCVEPAPGPGPGPNPGPITNTDPKWFHFYAEITGSNPAPWGQTLQDRLGFDGFGFWAPFSSNSKSFIQNSSRAFIAYMPASNRNMPAYQYTYNASTTSALEATLREMSAGADPSKIFWDGMPEFDQGGGDWSQGRPQPSSSLSRQQNYEQFRNHYLNTLGIGSILSRSRDQRGYGFAAVSDYPWTAHWVLDWGADLVMGERIIDELSGMVPGASFYRGAGRQYGKAWGYDFSTWRYWTSSPTQYDANNRLTGGWSSSWFKRHMYLAYMGGANVLHMEPAEYFSPSGAPNPLGQAAAEFSDFALRRHRNRPPEHVPFALIVDRYGGFDPKFGQYMQGNGVWYGRLPYADGDYMLNNVLRMAYPDHHTHGSLVPGGPTSVQDFRNRLAAGADPRAWEPMGKTRWGDAFNILHNNASAAALGKHRVVMLTTHVPIDTALRSAMQQFVQNGGVLILNAAQVSSADSTLTGATVTGQTATGTQSQWVADGTSFTEPAFTYSRLGLQGATVVARTPSGDPLITRHAVGSGEVYLTTPRYLQDNNRSQILNIGQKLFDVLNARYAPASVQGPTVLYQLNNDGKVTTVSLYNGGGSTWSGTVRFPSPSGSFRTVEWVTDAAVANSHSGGQVSVSASVPPYDVRIYALERSTP